MIEPFYDFINKKILNKENKKNFKKIISRNLSIRSEIEKGIESKIIESFNREIDELINEINSLEKSLLEKPSEEIIEKYKKTVKAFIKRVNENYRSFVYKRWRGGQVKIWQIVNKKIEDLCKEVIMSQVKAFSLLEKLNELKGLIIDLKIEGV